MLLHLGSFEQRVVEIARENRQILRSRTVRLKESGPKDVVTCKRAEKAVLEGEKYLLSIVDHTSEAIITSNTSMKMAFGTKYQSAYSATQSTEYSTNQQAP